MDDIKVGDVVVLRSGGPKLTVTEIRTAEAGPRAECHWFEDTDSGGHRHEYAYFPVAALRKVDTGGTVNEAQRQRALDDTSQGL